MKLYALDHCPFCARVRTMLGLKNIPFNIEFISQDDSETPTKITGSDLMPIIEYDDNQYMMESLDIIDYLDKNYGNKILTEKQNPAIVEWINRYDNLFDHLTSPLYYKMDLPELSTDSAREAYRKIHEGRIESFETLSKKSPDLLKQTKPALEELVAHIDLDRVKSQKYSLDDIILYSMLRHISSIKEITFPDTVNEYIDVISKAGKLPSYKEKAASIYS